MSMHNAIGAEMLQGKQGKSCIHMYMYVVCLILSWYVYKVDASFFIHIWLACYHLMFIALLPCLGCYLALWCMMGCSYVRWMLGFLIHVWVWLSFSLGWYICCFGIMMPWLYVKCMLVCVWVRIQSVEHVFNKVKM